MEVRRKVSESSGASHEAKIMTQNTAAIFYIDDQRLSGHANPFGVRYDGQILPSGSVVCGFLKWDTRTQSVLELIDEPLLSTSQTLYWQQLIEDVRQTVGGNPVYGH